MNDAEHARAELLPQRREGVLPEPLRPLRRGRHFGHEHKEADDAYSDRVSGEWGALGTGVRTDKDALEGAEQDATGRLGDARVTF